MQNVKDITIDGNTVTITDDSGKTIVMTAATIKMTNLPTSDPSVAGQLWANNNVVTVSAG